MITTGFDETWARAMAATGEAPAVLSAGEALVARPGRTLIHAFGRAARPETLCLAPVDLPRGVAAHGLEDVLRELARACSFIYVGFEPGIPDLEWLAGRVLGMAALQRQHFALVTGGAAGAPTRLGYGIRPIAWDGSLEDGLAALADVAVEAAGAEALPEMKTGGAELETGGAEAAVELRTEDAKLATAAAEAVLELETGGAEVEAGEAVPELETGKRRRVPGAGGGPGSGLGTGELELGNRELEEGTRIWRRGTGSWRWGTRIGVGDRRAGGGEPGSGGRPTARPQGPAASTA